MNARVIVAAIAQRLVPAAAVCVAMACNAADWLQFGGDAAHSGCNGAERGYSTAGNHLLLHRVLAGVVDSAPLYVSAVVTPTGTRDLLIALGQYGMLAAYDATDGSLVWSVSPSGKGTSTTGAPAVDAQRRYVYAYGMDGKVHKYTIGDGVEQVDAFWPELTTLKPDIEKSASALTIAGAANGHAYLYAVANSYYDVGDFQGHITAIDLDSGAQNVFNAQCSEIGMHFIANGVTSGPAQNDCTQILSPRPNNNAGSGIWGRAGAVFDAASDRVYVATGNGLFDPLAALGFGRDWGDSVLALNADGTGAWVPGMPLDSYTPVTFTNLLQNDADLGSTSPTLLPAPAASRYPHLALQGGKDGCVRLLNLAQLGGAPGPGHVGGELQAINLPGTVNHCVDGGNLGTFKAQAAAWVDPAGATWAFIGHNTGFVAYRLDVDEGGNPALTPIWSNNTSGTSPVVANGTVYYVATNGVYALDAISGSVIWSDTSLGGIHWQSPIVVNGRLFVFDSQRNLWVYALDGVFRSGFE